MTVIDIDSRRDKTAAPMVCACGSHWFSLWLDDPANPGAICLNADGHITGYAGTVSCRECGRASR